MKKIASMLLALVLMATTAAGNGLAAWADEESAEAVYAVTVTGSDESGEDILNVTFKGEAVENCYLLLAKGEEGYEVLNPAEDNSAYSDLLVYHFAGTEGSLFQKTTVILLSYHTYSSDTSAVKITKKRVYLLDGQIKTLDAGTMIRANERVYQAAAGGKISLYTGLYEGNYYEKGKLLVGDSVCWRIYGKYLYRVNTDGSAAVYIRDKDRKGSYIRKVSGSLISVSYKTGKLKLYTGIYKGYYYKEGSLYKPSSARRIVEAGYLYSLSKSGKVKKYISSKISVKYVCLVRALSGETYLYRADKKTARAVRVIKNKKKKGSYPVKVGSRYYKIAYMTGKCLGLFTGVTGNLYYSKGVFSPVSGIYAGKYISGGRVKTFKHITYKIVDSYLYRIEKNGSASVYIRNSKKAADETYSKIVGAYRCDVSYATGMVLNKEALSIAALRNSVVETAESYLGYSESASGAMSHMNIVNIYNNYIKNNPGTGRNYQLTEEDSWCACYVSSIFIQLGYTKIFPVECSCGLQVAGWKDLKRWEEKDSFVPKKGDIIYYSWKDSGKGNCKLWPNHVGLVVSVANGKIRVIEGNCSDMVMERTIKVNSRYIRGFGRPDYAKLM